MSSDYVSLNRVHLHTSRKREIMAGAAMLVSIAGFVLQTEVLGVVSTLGYQKPIFVMYITHCCMISLFPLQILVLWLRVKYTRNESFQTFFRKHTAHLKHTAIEVAKMNNGGGDVKKYAIRTLAVLALALNCAGASWYVAVNWTTTSDLTAIYNCSTFFAYGFSVWLLHERINLYKMLSVVLSVIGVFIVAYLGAGRNMSAETTDTGEADEANRKYGLHVLGNITIAVGTVLYGLYEVLYKKIACPPQTVSAKKQTAFANFVGSGIGVATMLLMWPALIILHILGWETFEIPSAKVLGYLILSIIANVSFSGSFLVLMSLTSPVLGSVSSLLATCAVPLVNFIIWREKVNFAEICGGLLILGAFALLTWASADDFIEEDEPADLS